VGEVRGVEGWTWRAGVAPPLGGVGSVGVGVRRGWRRGCFRIEVLVMYTQAGGDRARTWMCCWAMDCAAMGEGVAVDVLPWMCFVRPM
jgi:hypothetical protein